MRTDFPIPEDDLVRWRRHVHRHPELSFCEHQTVAYVEAELRAMGIEAIRRPTDTSLTADIVGTLPATGPVRTIALRADMDALPVEEAEGLEFCSENPGVSHVCGHDAHVAILLGTAKVLTVLRSTFAGRVRLIFQHAEESLPGGARDMVAAGVLDGVDACAGLHVWNDRIGRLSVCTDRVATTASDAAWITIEGRGTHGSMPHAGIDPILVGSELVGALHTIVSRNISPDRFVVVSPTVFEAGNVVNVIPQTARIGLNIRTKDADDRALVRERVYTLAEHVAAAHGAKVKIDWQSGYDAIVQDEGMIARALRVAKETLPEQLVATRTGWTASEDFSAFANRVPAVYLFLGAGGPEEGYHVQNHHPAFRADERCLPYGVAVETAFALDFLAGDR